MIKPVDVPTAQNSPKVPKVDIFQCPKNNLPMDNTNHNQNYHQQSKIQNFGIIPLCLNELICLEMFGQTNNSLFNWSNWGLWLS